MLKITITVLAIALAGTANAAGWRSLRVNGNSDEAFAESLEAFKEKMSPTRAYVFGEALKDIWIQGAKTAEAEQREYTADEYYRQLDGMGYKEVVKFTDPTGDTAKMRYKAASLGSRTRLRAPPNTANTGRWQRDSSSEHWSLSYGQPRSATGSGGPGLPGDPRFQ